MRYRFTSTVGAASRRTAQRTTDARSDIGNRQFVLTLPSGTYESEEDDAAKLTRINRIDSDIPREFVVALPQGAYTIESDDDGEHIYREPDEPVRVALTEPVVDVAHRATSERAALRRLNEGHTAFWDRQSRATAGTAGTLAGVNERNASFWANRK